MNETPDNHEKSPEEEAAARKAWEKSLTAGSLPTWWKPEDGSRPAAPQPPASAPPGAPPAPMAAPAPPPAGPPAPSAGDPAATVQMPRPVGGPAVPAPAPPLADPDQRTMVLGTFPAAPLKAQLMVRTGPDAGTTFTLGPEIAYLGRARDNQLVVNDPATSRRHARFEVRDRRFILVDLGSANGCAIDGVRVVLEQPLTSGCTIAIGQNQIEVAIG